MTLYLNGTSGISGVDGSSSTPALQGTDSNTGISFGSDVILGSTGGTERFRCDSSGRLLVGTTTTSAAPLTVNGTIEANSSLYRAVFGNGYVDGDSHVVSGGNGAELQVQASTSNRPAVLSLGGAQGASEYLGAITFFNSGNTDGKRCRASIVCGQEGSTANQQGGVLTFSTTADGASSPTERWRINSGGTLYSASQNVHSGTEGAVMAGGGRFTAHGDFYNGIAGAAFSTTDNTNGAIYIQFGNSSGTRIGSITRASSTTIAYNTSSDYRLKEDFEPVPQPIARLKQIKPTRFNFKGYPDERMDGFIAHELQEVIPEAVTGQKDAVNPDGSISPQGVDQSKLVPLLTAALQEAITKIETLEARLSALESA